MCAQHGDDRCDTGDRVVQPWHSEKAPGSVGKDHIVAVGQASTGDDVTRGDPRNIEAAPMSGGVKSRCEVEDRPGRDARYEGDECGHLGVWPAPIRFVAGVRSGASLGCRFGLSGQIGDRPSCLFYRGLAWRIGRRAGRVGYRDVVRYVVGSRRSRCENRWSIDGGSVWLRARGCCVRAWSVRVRRVRVRRVRVLSVRVSSVLVRYVLVRYVRGWSVRV